MVSVFRDVVGDADDVNEEPNFRFRAIRVEDFVDGADCFLVGYWRVPVEFC